jgi:hypothetical protein
MSMRAKVSMAVSGSLLAALVVAARVEAQQQMMAMPSVAIESPANGATIAGNTIDVTVKPSNFTISCKDVGKLGDAPVQGHVHAMVDGLDVEHLSGMYCSNRFSISTAGMKPGKHTLAVVLADDAHAMASAPAMVSFEYAPRSIVPLPAANSLAPSVQILSPKSGATVDKKFNVTLAVHNFNLSCNAEGREDVAGVGHIHIFAYQAGVTDKKETAPMVAMMSTDSGKMLAQKLMQQTGMSASDLNMMASMTMPGLLGMPCTKTIPVDLSDWNSGPTRILVQLAKNDHMPAQATPAVINVNLK